MFNSPSNEGEFMDDKQLQALANELAKNLKTPEDLSQFDRLLKKIKVEAALNAEPNREPTPVMAIPRKPSHYRRADGITYST